MILRAFLSAILMAVVSQAAPMKALLIDGRNNHDWKATTPVLKKLLEETGLFEVTVVTAPPDNETLKSFHPTFTGYNLVVLNYNDFRSSKRRRLAGGHTKRISRLREERRRSGQLSCSR